MKFEIEKARLTPFLTVVSKNAAKNDFIYLKFEQNSVQLAFKSGYFDLTTLIMTEKPLDHPEIAVNAAQFARIITQIPSEDINFTIDHPKLKLSGGKSRYSLNFSFKSSLVTLFPHLSGHSTLTHSDICAINHFITPFSGTPQDGILAGVHFTPFDNYTEVVASNRIQLSLITIPRKIIDQPINIPASTITQLSHFLPVDNLDNSLVYNDSYAIFATKNGSFHTSIFPEPYFPYQRIFSKLTETHHDIYGVNQKELKHILKNLRVFIETKDYASKLIKIHVTDKKLTISSNSDEGDTATEEIDCKHNIFRGDFDFIIDINHLTRLIDVIEGENLVPWCFDQNLKSLITFHEGAYNWRTVTMLVQK